jgi:membrane-bound lytic murein transglycosylase B
MLAEHTFVTTREKDDALSATARFLESLGFRIDQRGENEVRAVRGRRQPNSRKVRLLPQMVRVTFDRGRVTAAASITARAGKEREVHSALILAVVRGLEALLVHDATLEQAGAEWNQADARAGSIWLARDIVALAILIPLCAGLLFLLVMALILIQL